MSVETSVESHSVANRISLPVRDYDLAATLSCGQAFRWDREGNSWLGVIDKHAVRLTQQGDEIIAQTATPQSDWTWLTYYLQTDVDLAAVLASFPIDAPMKSARVDCYGLRLLRQDPWECLASFILSSTKQIVQIRQIISLLCERYGNLAAGTSNAFTFPTAQRLAVLKESDLRSCKMGFRAPYLLAAAKAVNDGKLSLEKIARLDLPEARRRLVTLPGVGPKIADCVLLFAYGFPTAFPVDVWVIKALQRFYFRNRQIPIAKLREFSASYFGPNGGYAQQYLFHALRLSEGKAQPSKSLLVSS